MTPRLLAPGHSLLAVLDAEHRRLLRLCEKLEHITDELPGSARSRGTAKTIMVLDRAFSRHIFLHEKCLFPLLRSMSERSNAVESVLRQLAFEHAADQGLIIEIGSAFAGNGTCAAEFEGLGYLFRAFFENYRRHASWEQAALYPLFLETLKAARPEFQAERILEYSLGARQKAFLFCGANDFRELLTEDVVNPG